ncbi:hypothetical protein [Desulfallas thermosapovorans]|uniref:Uncharacterized protein n=1 Tax=Desulfallas thermosapovorans DSM 6562 TaxID=1121431 RepID=A0A5S4ZR66_9FIRM|nr:hypothetical protein [Desulfallas thermosapovorans]TYO94512.1 hypothetical protein LX24_02347 [Desulfallas thermosapovorans DSM 6562]
MKKIKDGITLGFLCGFLANIPKAIANEVLFRKKIESKRYGEVISGIFMPKSKALSKQGKLFGVGGDFVTSSILGIPLVYMMLLTGKDNFLLKGFLTGVIGLGSFRGLLANVGPGKTYPRDPQTNITFTINSAMWGIVASSLIVMLGNESLFKPKQAKNSLLNQP